MNTDPLLYITVCIWTGTQTCFWFFIFCQCMLCVNKEFFDFAPQCISQYMLGNMITCSTYSNCFSIIYIQWVICPGQQAHMSFVLNVLWFYTCTTSLSAIYMLLRDVHKVAKWCFSRENTSNCYKGKYEWKIRLHSIKCVGDFFSFKHMTSSHCQWIDKQSTGHILFNGFNATGISDSNVKLYSLLGSSLDSTPWLLVFLWSTEIAITMN